MAVKSDEAKARMRQRQRERYHWYVEHGICANCYKVWAEPGHVYCHDCTIKIKARQKRADPDGSKGRQRCKDRRERLKAAALCVDCGTRPTTGGKNLCDKCWERRKQLQMIRNIGIRANSITKGENP